MLNLTLTKCFVDKISFNRRTKVLHSNSVSFVSFLQGTVALTISFLMFLIFVHILRILSGLSVLNYCKLHTICPHSRIFFFVWFIQNILTLFYLPCIYGLRGRSIISEKIMNYALNTNKPLFCHNNSQSMKMSVRHNYIHLICCSHITTAPHPKFTQL